MLPALGVSPVGNRLALSCSPLCPAASTPARDACRRGRGGQGMRGPCVSRPCDGCRPREGGPWGTPLFREIARGTGTACSLVTPQASLFAVQGCGGRSPGFRLNERSGPVIFQPIGCPTPSWDAWEARGVLGEQERVAHTAGLLSPLRGGLRGSGCPLGMSHCLAHDSRAQPLAEPPGRPQPLFPGHRAQGFEGQPPSQMQRTQLLWLLKKYTCYL